MKDNVPFTNAPEAPNYSTPTKRVMEHPEYRRIVESLRAGVSVPQLVSWFDREGWLGTMSPTTFTQYLYKFKVERSELLDKAPEDKENYDAFIGTRIPEVDADTELDKLIMIQKRRLSADIKTELEIGKLLDNTHKEIAVMAELLKLKGAGGKASEGVGSMADSTALRELRVNEGAQDRMQELTTQLFESITNVASEKTSKASKKRKVRA